MPDFDKDEIKDLKTYWELPDKRLKELLGRAAENMMANPNSGSNTSTIIRYSPIAQMIEGEISNRQSKRLTYTALGVAAASLAISAVSLVCQ